MPPAPPTPGRPVPGSTILLVVASMVLVFSFGVDLSLGAPWVWWLIPMAALLLIGLVVVQRLTAH